VRVVTVREAVTKLLDLCVPFFEVENCSERLGVGKLLTASVSVWRQFLLLVDHSARSFLESQSACRESSWLCSVR
jgi:hypothetical protein